MRDVVRWEKMDASSSVAKKIVRMCIGSPQATHLEGTVTKNEDGTLDVRGVLPEGHPALRTTGGSSTPLVKAASSARLSADGSFEVDDDAPEDVKAVLRQLELEKAGPTGVKRQSGIVVRSDGTVETLGNVPAEIAEQLHKMKGALLSMSPMIWR